MCARAYPHTRSNTKQVLPTTREGGKNQSKDNTSISLVGSLLDRLDGQRCFAALKSHARHVDSTRYEWQCTRHDVNVCHSTEVFSLQSSVFCVVKKARDGAVRAVGTEGDCSVLTKPDLSLSFYCHLLPLLHPDSKKKKMCSIPLADPTRIQPCVHFPPAGRNWSNFIFSLFSPAYKLPPIFYIHIFF